MDEAQFKRALGAPVFPHPIEVFGACGLGVPLFLTYSTSTAHGVREWFSIGCGALAVAAGVFSLTMVRLSAGRVYKKRRNTGIALVGVGLFYVLIRGGLVG